MTASGYSSSAPLGGGAPGALARAWSGRLGAFLRASPLFAILLLLMACLLVPIGIGAYMSFRTTPIGTPGGHWTLHNFGLLIHDQQALSLLGNTALLTIGAAGGATVLGATLAWTLTNTNVPKAKWLMLLPMAPMILPGLLKCTAWIDLYAPRSGLVNIEFENWFGFSPNSPPFNIYSMGGMILILALSGTPIAYLIMLSPFGNLGRSYEEASRVSGAGKLQTLFRVIVPSVTPAILSAFALCAILVATSFETPILIGLPGNVLTYISAIYHQTSGGVIPNYNTAGAYASVYLLMTTALLVWYVRATRAEKRFAVVSGRDYVRQRIDVGKWRWALFAFVLLYFFLAFFQLVLGTLLVSIIPFYTATQGNPIKNFTWMWWSKVFHEHDIFRACVTSVYLAMIGAFVTTFGATLVAIASLKSKLRYRRVFEVMATLPVALPSFVFSTLLLLTVLFMPGLIRFYNTRWPLIVAFAIISLPLAVRVMSGTVIQLHDEFSEASSVAGANRAQTSVRVTLPLLRSALVDCASAVFSHNFKELGAIILLIGPNTLMLPTLIFDHWEAGDLGTVSALNLLSLFLSGFFIGFGMVFLRTQKRRSGARMVNRRLVAISEAEQTLAAVE
jgi:iron(III) transport system permease protein